MSKTASDFFTDSAVYQMSRLNWRVCSTSRIEYPISPLNLSDTCYKLKTPCLDAKNLTGQSKKGKCPFKWFGLVAPLRFLGLSMAYHVTNQLRLGLYCLFFFPMTSHMTNSYVIRHPRILHIWSTRKPALFNFTSLRAIPQSTFT